MQCRFILGACCFVGCRELMCLKQALKVWLGPCMFSMNSEQVCCRFIGCIRSAAISLLQVDLVFICCKCI